MTNRTVHSYIASPIRPSRLDCTHCGTPCGPSHFHGSYGVTYAVCEPCRLTASDEISSIIASSKDLTTHALTEIRRLDPDLRDQLAQHVRSKCDITPDGCWMWESGRRGDGTSPIYAYAPRSSVLGRVKLPVKKLMGALLRTEPPAGRNTCRKPLCVNPDHWPTGG